jgi:hypothetical protein
MVLKYALAPPLEPFPSQYLAPWPSSVPEPWTVTPVPATLMSGPAQFWNPNVVVPEKVMTVLALTLVRSSVVPAGTEMPWIVIAVQDATARETRRVSRAQRRVHGGGSAYRPRPDCTR